MYRSYTPCATKIYIADEFLFYSLFNFEPSCYFQVIFSLHKTELYLQRNLSAFFRPPPPSPFPPLLLSPPARDYQLPSTSGVNAIALSLGYGHTCVIVAGGGVKCWGLNDHGQLGIRSTVYLHSPTDLPGMTRDPCNREVSEFVDSVA